MSYRECHSKSLGALLDVTMAQLFVCLFLGGGNRRIVVFSRKTSVERFPKYLAVGCAPGRVQEIPSTDKEPLA